MTKIGRNDLCPCGSKKKYKKCCMEKDKAMNKEKVNKQLSSALNKYKISECLYPDHSECSERIVKAHSIQNNKILSKISKNGEVAMVAHNATETDFNMQVKKVGRSVATTFTGFCEKHDKIVFQPIEDSDYSVGNLEQNALFAFRAFSKEYHAKLSAFKLFEDYASHPAMSLALLGNQAALLNDMNYCLDVFKKVLFKKKFDLIETKYTNFYQEFDLSLSTSVTLDYDFKGGRINNLFDLKTRAKPFFLTIFPENGKTHILFSFLKEDKEIFAFLDHQLINLNEGIKKVRLTNLTTLCENLVMSPILWDKLGVQGQKIFLDRFLKNIKEEDTPGELSIDYGLNIFI